MKYKKLRIPLIIVTSFFILGCSDQSGVNPIKLKKLKTIKNTLGMEFVLLPGGKSFVMGEATREECATCNAALDETPRHRVYISKSFYMSRFEVTQDQWVKIIKENPSHFKGNKRPVENVTWAAVKLFIQKLNAKERTSGYRLPTEAEWEYAARAGTATAYFYGDNSRHLDSYAWYSGNSGFKTRPIGERRPNAWGIYDIMGNVYEWCEDAYLNTYYARSPQRDPKGPKSGVQRVRRGGAFNVSARRCRVSDRDFLFVDQYSKNTGFRLVRTY